MNKLHFDHKLGDIVRLSDGRTALIIHYGIYDNQYWCEVHYPDGVHLCSADYFNSDTDFFGMVADVGERSAIIGNFAETITEHSRKWGIDLAGRMGVFANI